MDLVSGSTQEIAQNLKEAAGHQHALRGRVAKFGDFGLAVALVGP